MTPQQFLNTYQSTAKAVSAGTGIDFVVLLAQWANETAWGTAWAGAPYNLGNIRNGPSGSIISYASLQEFVTACIATWHNGYYTAVLAARTPADQLAAICASPWSSGHYGGSLASFYDPLRALVPAHTSATGDSNMAIIAHPYILDRFDVLVIGTDGNVYHFWGTTDALTKGGAGAENWGAPTGGFAPGTLSAAWYNDPANLRLVAQAVRVSDSLAYLREVDNSGAVVREWTSLASTLAGKIALVGAGAPGPVGPAGPTGPAGPQGPPGPPAPVDDDTAYVTKAALKTAIGGL